MNISHIRHFTKLASDYITAFDSSPIKEFFPLSPNERGKGLKELIEWHVKLASTHEAKANRKVLIETLHRQHSNAGTLTAKVEENLKALQDERCLAVVTGQQVGILGGPLYTLYKALHTIILANELQEKYPEYQFVPIFWQETEDHDFEETSVFNIITSNFELRNIKYTSANDISRRQIGGIQFEKEALERVFSEIESFVPKTDFTEKVLAFYKAAYQEDYTFAEAQAHLLGELLSEDGLLILNANTPDLKKQAAHLFRKEIETAPVLSESIQKISKNLLSDGYHAQLDQQGMNLFLVDDGKRYKLSKTETGFSNNSISLTRNEVDKILLDNPERFSMNVVMRPLVQDTILPTVAYVAGPGEIAYFAQLRSAYEWAGIKMPVIVPRIGMTIIEDRFEKLLDKYKIKIEDFLEKGDAIIAGLLHSDQESILSDSFAKVNKDVDTTLESLRRTILTTDSTLDPALTSLKGKLLTSLKDFESKSLAAERKKQSGTKLQFEKALNVLLPDGKLQERELNLLYFLNKYGMDFWKKLKQELIKHPISSNQHQIVRVSDILNF